MEWVPVVLRSLDGSDIGSVEVETDQPLDPVLVVRSSEETARVIVEQLAGQRVRVRDADLATSLIALGGIEESHRMLLVLDVAAPSHGRRVPPGFELRTLATEPSRYAPLYVRAYPPSHPDADPAVRTPTAAEPVIAAYLRGEAVGRFDTHSSCELRSETETIVGAAIVNHIEHPLFVGPWLTELIVDPAYQGRGLGGALVAEVARRLDSRGHQSLGLAVTVGIPAQHLYHKLGFSQLNEAWSMRLAPA